MNRSVPLSVKLTNLFGGFLNQFGWIFFGFGMIFFWVFGSQADMSFLHFKGKIITVQGTALGVAETNTYINDVQVLETFYKFNDELGEEWQGNCFASGIYYNEGDVVSVEYPKGKPYLSRIKGMRRSMMSPMVLFVVIFPLIGLLFVMFGILKGLKANRILKNGIITKGKLVNKARTGTEINEQPVYKLTFQFKDSLGNEQQTVVKTHQTAALEDEKLETLIYLEANPSKAVLTDALPGSLKINESGMIKAGSFGGAITVLIIPAISILGHGLYLMSII